MAQSTIILGAGIIGVSAAYYLSESSPGTSIHLIEPAAELFASASGYAAGFLAADWFAPSVADLGRLSFEEHKRLAEQFDGRGKWGYSKSTGLSYTVGRRPAIKLKSDWVDNDTNRANIAAGISEFIDKEAGPRWLSRTDDDDVEVISEDGSTAQVDPRRLCVFLLEKCLARGVQLHHPARAISIDKDMRDKTSTIQILNIESHAVTDIPCTKILIAAGAWSPRVFSTLFPNSRKEIPVTGLAGHSLVVRSPRWLKEHEGKGCHAIFTTDEAGYSPEIFSRIGGEIYIAGLNAPSLSLPALATDPKIDDDAVTRLKDTARRLLGVRGKPDDIEVVRKGLCFRPVTRKGTPILAKLPDEILGPTSMRGGDGGIWLAAGHGPWGISLSLGTGKVMSEMILGRQTSAHVGALKL